MKKNSFAKFSGAGRKSSKGPKRIYAKGLTSHNRRREKVKEVSGNCWWVECYLMDRCGLIKTVKQKGKNG